MAQAPAVLFRIDKRGFLREGYHADVVLVNPNKQTMVTKNNLLYKCGWSPFEGVSFSNAIDKTFVSGNLVYENDQIIENSLGQRMLFNY
jgi:dihydroorotase